MDATLLDRIARADVLRAIAAFSADKPHLFADSIKYDLVFDGKRYPPKAIVGLAAESIVGRPLTPKDFKGGLESKCFRVLESLGFTIERKPSDDNGELLEADTTAWILQGNPKDFDIDKYLSEFHYVYWAARQHRSEIEVGHLALLWRSTIGSGLVAVGRVVELPAPLSDVRFRENLGTQL